MEEKVMAVTGTHGTGKTTEAYGLVRELKIQYPDKIVGLLAENCGRCPYPINQETTPQAQQWIFANHLSSELEMLSGVNILVTDRSVVDAVAYTMAAGFDGLALAMLDLARFHMHVYDKLIFKRIELNDYCFADGLRARDGQARFRLKVQDLLVEFYQELGLLDKIRWK